MTRTAWIFSYTEVARSPRVVRQARALSEANWKVVIFGYQNEQPLPEDWTFVSIPKMTQLSAWQSAWLRARRAFGLALTLAAPLASIRQYGARVHYQAIAHYREASRTAEAWLKAHPDQHPALVICHDYFTCPTGFRIARKTRAHFTVDCHEYAREECMDDALWVRRVRPFAIALQDYYLARADAVSTVCDGIADLLNREQILRHPVTVIRSLPIVHPMPFRPCGDKISVVYHGNIHPGRDLDVAIRSLPMWRPEFELLLRGYARAEYIKELEELADSLGVRHRLRIMPPVPFPQLIASANEADIGYFVQQSGSPQRQLALPNKLFEYIAAGLALCVSDLPEMAKIVRRYDTGALVSSATPQSVAAAINSLDVARIEACKRNSLEAAKELNWQSEKERMLSLYEGITT